MEPRERVALKENNRMAMLSQRDCGRRASWTATGHSKIKIIPGLGHCHQILKVSFREPGRRQFL
jgi:hypothetical protein